MSPRRGAGSTACSGQDARGTRSLDEKSPDSGEKSSRERSPAHAFDVRRRYRGKRRTRGGGRAPRCLEAPSVRPGAVEPCAAARVRLCSVNRRSKEEGAGGPVGCRRSSLDERSPDSGGSSVELARWCTFCPDSGQFSARTPSPGASTIRTAIEMRVARIPGNPDLDPQRRNRGRHPRRHNWRRGKPATPWWGGSQGLACARGRAWRPGPTNHPDGTPSTDTGASDPSRPRATVAPTRVGMPLPYGQHEEASPCLPLSPPLPSTWSSAPASTACRPPGTSPRPARRCSSSTRRASPPAPPGSPAASCATTTSSRRCRS